MPEDPRREALRAAFDEFAAEQLPGLVEEAQAIALERLRAILADAATEALLARAEGRAVAPGPAPGQAPAQEGDGAYVYAVVPVGTHLADMDGVGGSTVTLVEHGQVAAVCSEVPLEEFDPAALEASLDDLDWLEGLAREHERVVDTVRATTTVVPLRLCTIFSDERNVRSMLEREQRSLVESLHRLDGATEWGVKLVAAPGALDRAAAGTREPVAAASTPGSAYLDRKRQELWAREDAHAVGADWADEAHGVLVSLAREAVSNPPQPPEVSGRDGVMLLNGAYLVDDDRRRELTAAVEQLQAAFADRDVDVELTGPWPAYNFVDVPVPVER